MQAVTNGVLMLSLFKRLANQLTLISYVFFYFSASLSAEAAVENTAPLEAGRPPANIVSGNLFMRYSRVPNMNDLAKAKTRVVLTGDSPPRTTSSISVPTATPLVSSVGIGAAPLNPPPPVEAKPTVPLQPGDTPVSAVATRPPLPTVTTNPGSCVVNTSGQVIPIAIGDLPALSQEECEFYTTKIGAVALCYSSANLQYRDIQAKRQLHFNCSKDSRIAGEYASGLFQHPTVPFCNASNTAKTGIFSFIPRSPIGTQNFLSILGIAISALFAGCNNSIAPDPGVLPPAQK